MQIIVGHTNMDLDCLGSIAIARVLFPGARALRSRLIHPVARNLYNLYADHLDLGSVAELAGERVESIVVVDTRSMGRVKEFFPAADDLPPIEVWDHHPAESSDIPGAVVHEAPVGANTTLLGMEGMKRGIRLCADDATIALAGIYADTGNFTHENVSLADFEVAGWLKGQGASIVLVKSFLQTLQEESQVTLFHELLNRVTYQTVHGHLVVTTYMEMERQIGGLAAVVEKVFEVENPDAIFCVFFFGRENETLIIARSQQRSLDVARVLSVFRGGGHPQASSALLKGADREEELSCAAGVSEDDADRRDERRRDHEQGGGDPARQLDLEGCVSLPGEGGQERCAGRQCRRRALRIPQPARHREGRTREPDERAGALAHGPQGGIRNPADVSSGDRRPLLLAHDIRPAYSGRGPHRGHCDPGRVSQGPRGRMSGPRIEAPVYALYIRI